ncbi:MAG: phytanoyl-CoA dioxygenase family protein [Pseudomonadota bacterium]
MTLASFDQSARTGDVAAALKRDGAVILSNQVDAALAEAVRQEMRPSLDAIGHRFESDFNGYRTLRIGAILAVAPSAATLLGDSRVLEIVDRILLPHCINYRVGSMTGIEILPGETAQMLHTDDSIYPVRLPGMELQVSVMWALGDFTLENGATRVVPGSHKWHEPRDPVEDEVVQSTMAKGSALIYMGSLWHGGGANRSDRPRMGLINTYALGWLRQEENQYLTIPQDVAARYPDSIRRLLGYQSHGPILGTYPDEPDGNWYTN